ncbi:EF-hand domain-containing protein [Caenorhabditis elegans]|uniref:EF-hand domain-containing protein n=1 Tax=Caenorhabditis elegans TaxID=6239 RepID=Q3HKD3_CAEEL|nr:EF-hand domain-containing protein [Caenorhabditis elegans]CCD66009.1 EF-hand domain-containing protein [Caenorhabditis elegans]|eukprot:NP_001033352.1 Uncharacterized protein CELE_C29E4.14 [Caenorhabditis elegans]
MFSALFLLALVVLTVNGFDRKVHSFASDDDLSIEHLKDHYGNKIEIEKHTSSKDRKFYYFKVGDTNQDNHLDGVELFKMITEHSDEKTKMDVEMIEVQADLVLSELDKNGDGMISFSEYSKKFS